MEEISAYNQSRNPLAPFESPSYFCFHDISAAFQDSNLALSFSSQAFLEIPNRLWNYQKFPKPCLRLPGYKLAHQPYSRNQFRL